MESNYNQDMEHRGAERECREACDVNDAMRRDSENSNMKPEYYDAGLEEQLQRAGVGAGENIPSPEIIPKKLTGVGSAILFVVLSSALFLVVGSWVQSRDFNSGILITEFGLIMGGALIYSLIMRENPIDFFRLRRAKFSVYVKVFFMSFFMVPIAAFLNGMMIFLIEYFGHFFGPDIPMPEDVSGLPWTLFIVAVSAGICEEFMFRGALMSSFERKLGRRKSAFLAALFFGLFHFNLGNLLSPIALGMVFAYVTQVTGSIFPAMFGHFMNNANAVLFSFAISRLAPPDSMLSDTADPVEQMAEISGSQVMVIFTILVVVLIVCILAVKALLRSIRRSYPKRIADLYDVKVEEKYDYPTPEYSLWKKQPGRVGVLALAGILIYLGVYGYLSYITFFSVRW